MGISTAIGWTDHTFNPWWGCTRVSPGCQHCYAETFAKRTGNDVWGKNNERRFFGDKHWAEPAKWDRAAEAAGRPALVFCASMADVFEGRDDLDEHRWRLFSLIVDTPNLIWQLLTKRPENVLDMVPARWWVSDGAWPANCWVGITTEDQQRADERISHLLVIPAPVRFLSYEPALGDVDLGQWTPRNRRGQRSIGWVICGGESGPGHRPLNLDHARHLRDQCAAADIPYFFKQVGGTRPTSGGVLLDGRTHKAFPLQAGAR
jgi:protein gp37